MLALQPCHPDVHSSNIQATSKDDVKRTHKVNVVQKRINEFEDNPELIGGAFATLLPLGFTKDDIGKGGTLPSKLIRTWLLSHDRRFAEHIPLITSYLTRRFVMRLIPK